MTTFKFACPVCGQHICCDPDQAGSQLDCPTCFQKITVPQAPKTDSGRLIITASKVTDRPAPKVPDVVAVRPAKSKPPLAAIGFFTVLIAAIAAGFIFKDKLFKPATAPEAPVAQTNSTPGVTNASAPR